MYTTVEVGLLCLSTALVVVLIALYAIAPIVRENAKFRTAARGERELVAEHRRKERVALAQTFAAEIKIEEQEVQYEAAFSVLREADRDLRKLLGIPLLGPGGLTVRAQTKAEVALRQLWMKNQGAADAAPKGQADAAEAAPEEPTT